MTTRLQQLCPDGKISSADYRNIRLLTMLSKLVLALLMGVVVMIVSLMN